MAYVCSSWVSQAQTASYDVSLCNISFMQLCQIIEDLIGNSSIVDFGAGLGFYGWCFTRQYPEMLTTRRINRKVRNNFIDQMNTHFKQKPQVIRSYTGRIILAFKFNNRR